MPTIWDASSRTSLLQRFESLRPESQPRWGQFTVGRMVKHCADGIRMATGDLSVKPKQGPLRNWMLKKLIIYVAPWPKGAPTAPELLPAGEPEFGQAQSELRASMERVEAIGSNGALAEHAAFGKLNGKDWGALIHRHLDHHLKQFGA